MAIENFIKVLSRHKITLVIVPVIAVIITFFLVRSLPDSYTSSARIAAGIIDNSSAIMNGKSVEQSQAEQDFSNIIQTMMLKNVVNQVSYTLAIHDLTSPVPFRKPGKLWTSQNNDAQKHAIALLTEKYNKHEDLSLNDKEENFLYRLLVSLKYDQESLLTNLLIYRVKTSDFVDLNYEAENPQLTAFVLNTLCKETIAYYTNTVNNNNRKSVDFLDSLLQHKQAMLQEKMKNLRDYKVRNGILDVNSQASTLISQIAEFEAKRQDAEKNISSYKGALRNIDDKFNPNDRKFFESSAANLNQDILVTKNRLNTVNSEYIKSGFDPKFKSKADSLQSLLSYQLNRVNDNNTYNPSSTKQELVTQKLNLEVSLELAKNSVSSLSSELSRLNSKLYTLVPSQAAIKLSQDEIDLATTEYSELSKKYEQARMDASFTVKLKQVETAMPGTLKPSKKMLLVILSGIISFTFCVVVLFVLFFIDNTINSTKELASRTNLPVLGELSMLNAHRLNMGDLWGKGNETKELQYFKGLLRSIRFELDNNIDKAKVIAITSLHDDEGKTFFALNLAYAYKMINKKVLLIDGNFDDPEITEAVKPALYLEDYFLTNSINTSLFNIDNNLIVFGNRGGDFSLLELSSQAVINEKMKALKEIFDVILIETPSLNKLNKAKEWMVFADKVVPVFQASQSIGNSNNEEIEYLTSLNGKLTGWVLNKAANGKGISIKDKKIKAANI